MKKKVVFKRNAFERFASAATNAAGSTYAFVTACMLILVWLCSGFLFNYSDTWQLIINTGTTIVTFLMVFLIQKTQNKDSIVIQIKLNELVAATAVASNRIIDVESLTEEELRVLHAYYTKLAEMTRQEINVHTSHSIEEARQQHEAKAQRNRNARSTRVPGPRRRNKKPGESTGPRENNRKTS